jgi:hypothetical protein
MGMMSCQAKRYKVKVFNRIAPPLPLQINSSTHCATETMVTEERRRETVVASKALISGALSDMASVLGSRSRHGIECVVRPKSDDTCYLPKDEQNEYSH